MTDKNEASTEEDEIIDQDELYEHFRLDVEGGQAPTRIDRFLFNRMPNISRNRIQNACIAGNIIVNGKEVKPSYKVRPHDKIQIVLPHPVREKELIPQDLPLNIVYEDDDIVLVNKAAGMVVHPAFGNYSGTLLNGLLYHFKSLPATKGNLDRPGLVHRIDKNTSGLLVIARSEKALNHLAKEFFDRTIERKYIALVWGDFKEDEGTITGNVGRNLKDRKIMDVFPNGEHGKHAITHYKVLERFNYLTLVECKLETGRTHQIRVHMKFAGHPLFNDETYGGNRILKGTTFSKYRQFVDNCFEILPRHALHAKTLGFTHPGTGKKVFFESELPENFKMLLDKWRAYTKNSP